jgi:hypothetical protein
MIRFRRIFDLTVDFDRVLFEQATEVFRLAFPYEPEGIDHIGALPSHPPACRLRPDTRSFQPTRAIA